MKKFAPLLIALLAALPVFAADPEVPQSIANNEYYQKSVEYTRQAKDSYEYGDYDASASYAEQAAEYARLSDAYVSRRLAEYTLARAHSRYTWAGSVGAAARYPAEYQTATTAYNEAVAARDAGTWDASTDASNRVLAALANVQAAGSGSRPGGSQSSGSQPPGPSDGTLPAQYTVRNWSTTGDCLSAIAGWTWVYGDVYQWRVLYDANKSKLPNPNNPHLIRPGMILDIPSIKGEKRSGMYDPAAKY